MSAINHGRTDRYRCDVCGRARATRIYTLDGMKFCQRKACKEAFQDWKQAKYDAQHENYRLLCAMEERYE